MLRDILLTPFRPGPVQRRVRAKYWGERQALALVLFVCLVSLLIRLPATMEAPRGDMRPETQLGTAIVAGMLFAPLFLYLLAALLRVMLKLAGRELSWLEARILLFWTLLGFQPLILILAMLPDIKGLNQMLGLLLFAAFLLALWAGAGACGRNPERAG